MWVETLGLVPPHICGIFQRSARSLWGCTPCTRSLNFLKTGERIK
uniref:Uncharacterized protein n=1 Tax=Anguilla anguilla TaxID=7936 RepID=A0A0E9SLM1_ANGAN